MSVYFSKLKSETSEVLLQTCSDIRSMKLNAREDMHKLASYYWSSRQVSREKVVYHGFPEIWLRKSFSRTVFVNASKVSERIRICKSVEELEDLNPDGTDIFKQNMEDIYIDRRNNRYKNGMYGIVDHTKEFHKEFLKHFQNRCL